MSTTSTVLGIDPEPLRVILVTGADFYCTRTLTVAGVATSWPVGTTLSLVFDTGETWTASISTSVATFNVDKAVADLIADGTGVRFKYVNGTTDQTWEIGTVKRRG